MQSVDIPIVNYDGMEASEALLKFYAALGFNPSIHTLNPRKVKISEPDHLALTEQMKALNPNDTASVCLMLLSYGPSCDYDMKSGKVHLYSGWVVEG